MLVKVLTWLLALLFVATGVPKVLRVESAAAGFAALGYSSGFLLLIGVIEVVGGLALLVPAVARYGALALLGVMAGATWTLYHAGTSLAPPLVVGALLVVLVVLRERTPAR